MATMLLAGYVKPYSSECANVIWYAGVIGHALLIVWFTMKFVFSGFGIKKVFPSMVHRLCGNSCCECFCSCNRNAGDWAMCLLALSVFFWALGMMYFLRTFRGEFMPSHSAFTFPLVISALAVKLSAGFTGFAWQGVLCEVETVVAAAIVLWVLVRYVKFVFTSAE